MNRGERGFTLVELLVALALTGLVFTVVASAIYQLSITGELGNNRLTVTHELQNAAFWFNTDAQMALTASGGSALTLNLPSGQVIIYDLSGTSLRRTTGSSITTLAQNISNVDFSVEGQIVSMSITSSLPGRMSVSEQASYQVYMRPLLP